MNKLEILKVQNISKSFEKKGLPPIEVLKKVNFSVKQGECFVLIGQNGSGKTTLLRILSLLEPPSSGDIFYNNINLIKLKKKEKINFRRKISFVRQKPIVLNTTVANNLAYGLKIRGLPKNQIIRLVKEMLERIDLLKFANKKARQLSGGEIQRVVIAMNFILPSELYFLDEISANLDPQNVSLLEDFLNQIKKESNKTIILSTHNPIEAIKFGDKIAVLNKGTITQIGTPNEIFMSPKDEFTALFLGYQNIFTGIAKIDKNSGLNIVKINDVEIIVSMQKEGDVKICVHPESIVIAKNLPENTSFRNNLRGIVSEIRDYGNICHVIVNCSGEKFLTTITKLSAENLKLEIGSKVYISFKATDVKCF